MDALTQSSILLDLEFHKAKKDGSKFYLHPVLRRELYTLTSWNGVLKGSFKAGELMGFCKGVAVYASEDEALRDALGY